MKDTILILGALITMGSIAGLFVHFLGLTSVTLLIGFVIGIILLGISQTQTTKTNRS